MRTGLVFDDRYLEEDRGYEVKERLTCIRNKLKQEELWGQLKQIAPEENYLPTVSVIHSEDHIKGIQSIAVTGKQAALAVSGVLSAVRAVAQGEVDNAFCVIRPPGHHAFGEAAVEGYCYYANSAAAARFAQKEFDYERVAIIDWDFHHGNGTEKIFYDDPSVLTISTHHAGGYPQSDAGDRFGKGSGKGFNLNIALDTGAGDEEFLGAWRNLIVPKVTEFNPDLIIIGAGFDSRMNDTFGCFRITDKGFYEATRMAVALADKCCNGRLVSVLEGGYNPEGVGAGATAHVKALMGKSSVALAGGEEIDVALYKMPVIQRYGWLFFESDDFEKVSSIEVIDDDSGKVVDKVDLSEVFRSALNSKTGLSKKGRYTTVVHYTDGIERRFSYTYLAG